MGIGNKRAAILGSIALAIGALGMPAWAAPMDFYAGPAITETMKGDPRACLNIGDAISCSAGMLNLLHLEYTGTALDVKGSTALSETNPAKIKGYIVAPSGQGALKQAITLGSGGEGGNPNGEIDPMDPFAKAEDGFKTNNAGDLFAATGKTGSTAGNLGDPDNNSLNTTYDRAGTWDVDINWLIQALTTEAGRHEIMFGFDYNQPQNSNGTVDYWALITVLDYDGGNAEKNFEINNNASGYQNFTSTKDFESKPDASEFGFVQTKTCATVDGNGIVTNVQQSNGGVCPPGTTEEVNNATGASTTEIIGFLPELNANLEAYAAQGYDAISVRMLFGCFTGTDYLNSGATTNCDGGGNVDVFLMAGAPTDITEVPEPATLAIVGTALLAAGVATRRRRAVKAEA